MGQGRGRGAQARGSGEGISGPLPEVKDATGVVGPQKVPGWRPVSRGPMARGRAEGQGRVQDWSEAEPPHCSRQQPPGLSWRDGPPAPESKAATGALWGQGTFGQDADRLLINGMLGVQEGGIKSSSQVSAEKEEWIFHELRQDMSQGEGGSSA